MDRLSVKFEFNGNFVPDNLVDTDTAEEVVNEMIHEEVLPAKYQHLITGEINRILRELNRPAGDEKDREETRQWNSMSRLDSNNNVRDSISDGHLSLSRKGSVVEVGGWQQDFEDFPAQGIENLIPEYTDDQAIEALVQDTAISTKRGMEKANEWLAKLKTQDVMTVGDLRDLQEEDWSSL
jgi:hypothetical protein